MQSVSINIRRVYWGDVLAWLLILSIVLFACYDAYCLLMVVEPGAKGSEELMGATFVQIMSTVWILADCSVVSLRRRVPPFKMWGVGMCCCLGGVLAWPIYFPFWMGFRARYGLSNMFLPAVLSVVLFVVLRLGVAFYILK